MAASACSETNTSSAMEKLYGTTFSGIFGYGHITGGYPGGQAEFVRVPFANTNCSKLPDDVPDEKGMYLSDTWSLRTTPRSSRGRGRHPGGRDRRRIG
jgi:threonine dehydrogenase-like Zn-dependent dehydrogenase